jgi:hypothetical protein
LARVKERNRSTFSYSSHEPAKRNIYKIQGSGTFFISSLSFPPLPAQGQAPAGIQKCLSEKLDARLRGHDGKNLPTPHKINFGVLLSLGEKKY